MPIAPTKKEALQIIRRCVAEDRFLRSGEFPRRLAERDYTIADVYRVLNVGKVERALVWREDCQDFEARIKGRTSDGRLTRVVAGISENRNDVVLVTIIDLDR